MSGRLPEYNKLATDGYRGMIAVEEYIGRSDVPLSTLELVRVRVSQINGCGFCVDMHSRDAKKAGESDERLWGVAAWRENTRFTPEERAALALAEAATRIADNPGGVPDEIWDEAARHYDKEALAALVTAIASINAWNRISVTTRKTAGPQSG